MQDSQPNEPSISYVVNKEIVKDIAQPVVNSLKPPRRISRPLFTFKPNKNAAFLKHLIQDKDDLDRFWYYYFVVGDRFFEVKRYRGNPEGIYTVSIYGQPSAAAQDIARDHLKVKLFQIHWNAIKAQDINKAEKGKP